MSEWELGVVSGLKDMKEKLSLCEVREAHMTLLVTLLVTYGFGGCIFGRFTYSKSLLEGLNC